MVNDNQLSEADRRIGEMDVLFERQANEVRKHGREAMRRNVIGSLAGDLPASVRQGWMSEVDAVRIVDELNQRLEANGYERVEWESLMNPQSGGSKEIK